MRIRETEDRSLPTTNGFGTASGNQTVPSSELELRADYEHKPKGMLRQVKRMLRKKTKVESLVDALLREKVERGEVSCLMVPLPKDLSGFHAAQDLIADDDVYDPPHSTFFGKEKDPHVTALFGLVTENPDDVKSLLTGFRTMNLQFADHTSVFENDDYDVVKVDVYSEDMHVLNKVLTKSLEVRTDYPHYHPHITLAYVKKGTGAKYANLPVTIEQADVHALEFSDYGGEKSKIQLSGVEETTTTGGLGGIPTGAVPGWQPTRGKKKRKTMADLANELLNKDPQGKMKALAHATSANAEKPEKAIFFN